MVIVRLKGGLGNQLFQYAAARAIAKRAGTSLTFDSRWYSQGRVPATNQRTFDLLRFNVCGREASKTELFPFLSQVDRRLHIRVLSRIARVLKKGSILAPQGAHDLGSHKSLGRHTYLDGYFQNPAFLSADPHALRNELSLKEPLIGSAAELERSLRNEESVCIQVRRTDYVSDPGAAKVHGVCEIDYYRSAWALIKRARPSARGRVFTDDPIWAAEVFRPWEDVTVVGPEYDGPGYLSKFQLMRACRHFIIANSTWGWWSAWLADHGAKTVVMPAQWYRDDRLNLEAACLQWPGWIVQG